VKNENNGMPTYRFQQEGCRNLKASRKFFFTQMSCFWTKNKWVPVRPICSKLYHTDSLQASRILPSYSSPPHFFTSYKEVIFLYFFAHNFDHKPCDISKTVNHTGKNLNLVKITNHPPLPFNPDLSATNFTVQDNWCSLLPIEFEIENLPKMAVFYGHLHSELAYFAATVARELEYRPPEIPCSLIYAQRRNLKPHDLRIEKNIPQSKRSQHKAKNAFLTLEQT